MRKIIERFIIKYLLRCCNQREFERDGYYIKLYLSQYKPLTEEEMRKKIMIQNMFADRWF